MTLLRESNLGGFVANRRGVAAVEFALVAPLFGLLLAGTIDIGGVLYTKFKLDGAVSAGANFAQVNAANVSSTNGPTLASNIATIVETSQGSAWANNTVVVNNGPSATVTGGSSSSSGTASNADLCYCPSGTPGSTSWGAAVTCGTACSGTDTGYAGKFVTITANHQYSPIFSTYGIVQNDTISTSVAVQVQ